MDKVRFLCTFLLALSVLCAIFLIFYSYKRRSIPGARYFFLLMFTAIIYNGGYIGELYASHFSVALFWFNVEHLAIPQHYLWVLMSIDYTIPPKKYLKNAQILLLYHPIVFYVIFYTNPIHHLYIKSYAYASNGYFQVITTIKGPLYTAMVISGTFLGIISTFVLIRGLIKSPKAYRNGYIIMIIATIFPWISVYLIATNTNYLGIDYYPITTFISGIFYLVGIFQLRIFNTIPMATEIVFRQSKEGILLIDITDNIIDANQSFLKLYPIQEGRRKRSFASFVKKYPEFAPVLEGIEKFEFKRKVRKEKRFYAVSINKVLTEDGLQIGKILMMDDITLYVEKQKNLEYIASNAMSMAETSEVSFLQAQISPHFINNTLSVIASMITRAPEEAKDLITYLGEYLSDRYYFDSNSATVLLEQELETVNTYVKIEKARFRERLNYHLRSDDIPAINIPRMTLQPLVENAIRHGILKKAGGGNVWLTITHDKGNLYFEIMDDGVGISEEKLETLLKEETTINSIGIQNINRRLLKYYSEGLSIKSKEGEGTTVFFTIPFDIQ